MKIQAYVLLATIFTINLLDHVKLVQSHGVALSVAGLESLVFNEKNLIEKLELYLVALERKADVIRSNIDRMKAENNRALIDVERYLMNPLTAFSLIRRLHSDWLYWVLYMQKPVGEEVVKEVTEIRTKLPTERDVDEAITGILRLQGVYELDPVDISIGKLNGVQYGHALSSVDCFSIAYFLYNEGSYQPAEQWFNIAVDLYRDDDTMNDVLEFDFNKVQQLYAQTLAKLGDLEKAVTILNQILVRDPTNINIMHLKKAWNIQINVKGIDPVPKVTNDPVVYFHSLDGCQGKFPQRDPRLFCIYNTTTNAFLKLAPLKMEFVSMDPYIVLYYDVISDGEIEALKELAMANFRPAAVFKEGKETLSPYRTGKLAWLPDDTTTEKINRKYADMTGFLLNTAERIQVLNYGIGGHYSLHTDHFYETEPSTMIPTLGNRIATALLYMSDVEQGGATVFPEINISVYPKKGMGIVWYNLDSRGDGDDKTLHAGCPVLYGSKWISNKWIREREQMFIRPCLP